MNNLNQRILGEQTISLPAMAEQRCIVAKIDQLMALCDKLEAKLKQSAEQSERLMAATVRALTSQPTVDSSTNPAAPQHAENVGDLLPAQA